MHHNINARTQGVPIGLQKIINERRFEKVMLGKSTPYRTAHSDVGLQQSLQDITTRKTRRTCEQNTHHADILRPR
jgi:hypothetical protein